MIWTDNYNEEGEKGRKYDLERMWKTKDGTDKEKKYEEDGRTEKKRTIKQYNKIGVKQSQIYIRRTFLMVEQRKTK